MPIGRASMQIGQPMPNQPCRWPYWNRADDGRGGSRTLMDARDVRRRRLQGSGHSWPVNRSSRDDEGATAARSVRVTTPGRRRNAAP